MNIYKTFFIGFLLLTLLLQKKGSQAQIVAVKNNDISEDTVGWQLALNIDFYTTKNTNTLYASNAGSFLQYKKGKHRIVSMNNYDVILSNSQGETSGENRAYQHIRYNYLWKEKIVWEAFSQIQYDEILRIQKRLLLGTGPRFNLMKKEKSDIHLGVAYMYEYEQELDTAVFHRDHRISSFLSADKTFENGHSISTIGYYQPVIDNFSDFRVSLGFRLALKIASNLAFNFNVNLNYDAQPVIDEDIPSLTYNIRNGLSISF